GRPPAGREVLNGVFLYHCTKAGLDYAIINAERLERYPSIPEEERRLAEDLLENRGADPVAAFAAHFRDRVKTAVARDTLPLDERLARYIVEGSRDGLLEDLDEKLGEAAPLEIINGPLLRGMDEVGRLFNDNQLIVAEEYGGLTPYPKDAMDGLDLANQLFSAVTREGLAERVRAEQAVLVGGATAVDAPRPAAAPARAKADVPPVSPPTPPDLEPHVLRHVPLAQVYPYLNLQMLYGKHLGLRGLVSRLLEDGDPKARELHDVVEALKAEAARDDLIRAAG